MSRSKYTIIAVGALLIFLVIWFGTFVVHNREEQSMACEAKNGVLFRSRESGAICIRRDAIL